MAARKFETRDEALEYYGKVVVKEIEEKLIVDIIDEKSGFWMMHPVIVYKIKGDEVYGYEITSSKGSSSYNGYIYIKDWKSAGLDDYCEYHTIECDKLNRYDINNIVGIRGKISKSDYDRAIFEHKRYCKYEGRGQTEHDLDSAELKRRDNRISLLAKAKVIIPQK